MNGVFLYARRKEATMAEEEKSLTPQDGEDQNDSGNQDDNKTFDEGYVKELREEAKKYRLKLREIEEAKKKLEDEKLTESEKEKARLKELETENSGYKSKLKSLEISSMIIKAAAGKDFIDLDAVELLANRELSSEDEVSQKDVDKVIDKLAKDKPYLVKSGDNTATAGAGNTAKKDLDGKSDEEKFADWLRK